MSDTKNIVVIGGGFAGVQVAKALELALSSQYRVILIEKRSHFFFNIAALRAAVEDVDEKIFIPYSGVFKKNGRVVQASVTAIRKNEVHISPAHDEFGSHIAFDYLVVATGAEYPEPSKLHDDTKAENVKHLQQTREAVKSAQKIVILGGGPVGIELAGEIKGLYPNKEVTIIEGSNTLIAGTSFPDKFKDKVKVAVEQMGINVVLNDRVVWESGFDHGFKARTVKTESGREFQSDLQFVAFGTKPRGDIIHSLDSSLVNPKTHGIKVRPTLQVDSDSFPNIYAVGDVTDIAGEGKLAMKAGKHSELVAKNIQATINGTPLTNYVSDPDAMLVTLGKNSGIGYLPYFGGITIGGFLSRILKSKGLFIDTYWKTLGSTPPR